MPLFSTRSLAVLQTCDEKLQIVFNEVIEWVDCTILEGARSDEAQLEAFRAGRSQLKPGQSKHNVTTDRPLSRAVDVAPYPIRWDDHRRFYLFAGFVIGTAAQLGIMVRCGADWDGDFEVRDQSFHDLPHFELMGG